LLNITFQNPNRGKIQLLEQILKDKAQVANHPNHEQELTLAKNFKTIVVKYLRRLLKMKLTIIITITTTKNMLTNNNKITMEVTTEMVTQVVVKT
jgi:hypothetical protein